MRLARNAPRQGGEAPPSQLAYLPLPVGYSLNHPVAPSAYYMQQAASNQGPLLAQLRTMVGGRPRQPTTPRSLGADPAISHLRAPSSNWHRSGNRAWQGRSRCLMGAWWTH